MASQRINKRTSTCRHDCCYRAVAILSQEGFKGKTAFFGGINQCRFKGKVVPGDKLKLETKIIKQKGPMGIGQAIASVDGKLWQKQNLHLWLGNNFNPPGIGE